MGHTETIPNWKELIDHYSALTVFPTSPGGIHNYKIFEDLWEKGDYPAIYFSGLKPENFAFSTWVINLNIDTPFYKSRLSSKYQFKTLKELVLAELENPNMDIFMGGMRNEVYREIDNAMKKSKFKKANKLILSAIEKDPLNPIYWWNLAQTYIRMEKLKEAKLATRFGIGLDPYFHPFWKAFL
jgi:tetratricopeptide (TPR) repeat protein